MTIQPTINQLRVLASMKGQMWGIRQDSVEFFALSAMGFDERMEPSESTGNQMTIDGNRIAHIHVTGALMPKVQKKHENAGLATSYGKIITETNVATASGAAGIVYHIDSPGGAVAGNIEASAAIRSAGIPTVAHCDGLACSAAYKLASQTDYIVATMSAEVGNIGTILTWADCSQMWKDMGVEFKALTNEGADLKSTFHLEPDEAQINFLQERINEAGSQFRKSVIEGRRSAGAEVSEEVFRAGWYSGSKAHELGLIDDIGDTSDAECFILESFA